MIRQKSVHLLDQVDNIDDVFVNYLRKIAELATQIQEGKKDDLPRELDTKAKRALYNNLGQDILLALNLALSHKINYVD